MDPQRVYMDYVHPSSLLRELSDLWHNDQLCDAVITVDKSIVAKAHKLMMFAASPKLKADSNTANQSAILEVCLPSGVTHKAVHVFLRYIYEGFLILTREIAQDLVLISEFLQINCLLNCCSDFLKECDSAENHVVLADVVSKRYLQDFPHVRTSPVETKEVVRVTKEFCKRPHADGKSSGKRKKLMKSVDSGNSDHWNDLQNNKCVVVDDDSSHSDTNIRLNERVQSIMPCDQMTSNDDITQEENGEDGIEDEDANLDTERSFNSPSKYIKVEPDSIKKESDDNELYSNTEDFAEQAPSMWFSVESQSVEHGVSSQFVSQESSSHLVESQSHSDAQSKHVSWMPTSNSHLQMGNNSQTGNSLPAAQGTAPQEMNAGNSVSAFPCQFCGKQYTRYDTMKRHTLVHRTWKHKCDRCGQGFYRKDYLLHHKRFSKTCGQSYFKPNR